MERFTLIILLSFASAASAGSLDERFKELKSQYLKAGGAEKPFAQTACFLKKNSGARFRTKPRPGNSRCDRKDIALRNRDHVAIIDYTKSSNKPRLFMFDLSRGTVRALYVSHGRYGETKRSNNRIGMSPKANSVLKAVHFSNELGKNASVGGFYLTANDYRGKYGRSLVLHGLEKNVNDNACARAVVIHQNHLVSDRGTNIMSSGCPMVADHRIDYVVGSLKGGALIYMHSPREEALSAESCGRDLWFAPRALD